MVLNLVLGAGLLLCAYGWVRNRILSRALVNYLVRIDRIPTRGELSNICSQMVKDFLKK